jgi:hypothetical protein
MPADYLHNHPDFPALLRILETETGILAGLIEKDYWIMHTLHGLQSLGLHFELKGGTSLSKGYGIIHRFSKDIDIHITPPATLNVVDNPSNNSKQNIAARKSFYDWLARQIQIDGIVQVERDTEFDDERYYRSGGIRLLYTSNTEAVAGLKQGIFIAQRFNQKRFFPSIRRRI